MPLVVVVAVALSTVAVDRLRGVFGSDKIFRRPAAARNRWCLPISSG
ncbi:conserved membrane family protein [Mycobacterium xenopi 4042]|uniref:Conserved membrane family protein n=1 Tax=Mycobacterium xenopi 4042 TaxID=1299334 RepID=X8AQZ0_MYCXE|nr:conserved membrane family protein [Mycobacterium xenopi 4042]